MSFSMTISAQKNTFRYFLFQFFHSNTCYLISYREFFSAWINMMKIVNLVWV